MSGQISGFSKMSRPPSSLHNTTPRPFFQQKMKGSRVTVGNLTAAVDRWGAEMVSCRNEKGRREGPTGREWDEAGDKGRKSNSARNEKTGSY